MTRYTIFVAAMTMAWTACGPQTRKAPKPSTAIANTDKAPVRAIWVWGLSDEIVLDSAERLTFYSFLRAPHGNPRAEITTVFLGLSERMLTQHTASVRDFLRDAHSRGLRVDYLTGDPLWALTDTGPTGAPYNQPSIDLLKNVLAFNAEASAPDERFDGFQQDTEPYLLRQPLNWNDEVDQPKIWRQYMASVTQWSDIVQAYKAQHGVNDPIELGLAIPLWWDPPKEGTSIIDHRPVQDLVDYVAIMNYNLRNPVATATSEVTYASGVAGKTVYVGFETLEVFWREPTGGLFPSTYAHSASYYYDPRGLERDVEAVITAFADQRSFAGVAYHYYEELHDGADNGETAYRSLELTTHNRAPICAVQYVSVDTNPNHVKLRFVASDPDNDTLKREFAVSPDGGATWVSLPSKNNMGELIANNTYAISRTVFDRWPQHTRYTFRVTATELTKYGLSCTASSRIPQTIAARATQRLRQAIRVALLPDKYRPAPQRRVTIRWTPDTEAIGYAYSISGNDAPGVQLFTTGLSAAITFPHAGTHTLSVVPVHGDGSLGRAGSTTVTVGRDSDGDGVVDDEDLDRNGDGIANNDSQLLKNRVLASWDFENQDSPWKSRKNGRIVKLRPPATLPSNITIDGGVLRVRDASLGIQVDGLPGETTALTVEMRVRLVQSDTFDFIPLISVADIDHGFLVLLKNYSNELSARSYYQRAGEPLGRFVGLNARNDIVLDGQWHHVAFCYNGIDQHIQLFVDGKRVAQHRGPHIPKQVDLRKGVRLLDASSRFDSDNATKKQIRNSAQLGNNMNARDWRNKTGFRGSIDDIRITAAALPANYLSVPIR